MARSLSAAWNYANEAFISPIINLNERKKNYLWIQLGSNCFIRIHNNVKRSETSAIKFYFLIQPPRKNSVGEIIRPNKRQP